MYFYCRKRKLNILMFNKQWQKCIRIYIYIYIYAHILSYIFNNISFHLIKTKLTIYIFQQKIYLKFI